MVTAYIDEKIDDFSFIRYFKDVDEESLVWHRDKKDRLVKVVSGESWHIQYDNMLPIRLLVNHYYTIPKLVYHRLLKGSDDLTLLILEETTNKS